MKSKILARVLAATVLVVGFFVTAKAQGVPFSVSSNYYPSNHGPQTYMMGTVSLPGANYNPNYNPNIPAGNVINPVIVPSASSTTCLPLLNTFNKFGSEGQEVAKLQNFLNHFNGARLNGQGFYGPATMQEVKNLQYTYGINPTGAQYEKTTALINAINCGQVLPKARVVYRGYVSRNYAYTPSVASVSANNIYPNPEPGYIPAVKTYPTRQTSVGNPMVGKVPTST